MIGTFVAPAERRSSLLRYGMAALLPFIGFIITWQVFHLQRAPYFGLFMTSVVIVSLYGGTGAGLVDTAISSCLGFLVAQPAWTLRLSDPEDGIRIGLFTVLGILISTILGVVGDLQRKLNQERGTLATTLRSIGDAVVTTDKNGTITFLNDVAEQATGWALEEAIGKPIEAIVPLLSFEDREPILNPVRQVLESGRIATLMQDTLLVRRDGSEILIDDSAAPIHDAKKEITGVVQVFHDITFARKEAEMERHRLREILANAPAAIGVMRGSELRWEYLNGEYLRVLGRGSDSDFIGKTLRESLPELENQPYIGLLENVYRTGTPYIGSEMKATLNRGSYGEPEEAFFDLVFQPLRDRSDCVDGVLIHAVEVTDRLKIREQIQETEKARRHLATIVESCDDAIISKDRNGIITSWNPGAAAIFGYTAAEIIGKSITTIIPPELHQDEQTILQTIARGERIEHFETTRITKSGEPLSVSVTISPLRDEAGRVIGAAKVLRDITRQKVAERALHQSERLACVGRLATTVAHEINNPLEAVTNLVYLAKQTSAQDEVQKLLQIADEELGRIAYITRQTLCFNRESKGAVPVRLGTLIDSAISVASKTRNKGIKICPEVRRDPEICAIPGEVRQLMINLLSNGIDAVDFNGRVRLRVSEGTDWSKGQKRGVRLVVADSGCGIPEKGRSSLFQPFFTTKKDVGTGLGLWICKNIVERHGGSIRIKSSTAPGKSGTVFSVFLPLLPPETIHESQYQSVAAAG